MCTERNVKHIVPYWIIVHAKGRKPEYFHPLEEDAADKYYHKCKQAALDPLVTKEYTH